MTTAGKTRFSTLAAVALLASVVCTALLAQPQGGGGVAAAAPVATKSANLKLVTDTSLRLSAANESPRAVAMCPGALKPYGGALSADPDPDREGEGVYPHSYERLGAQSGFHSTPVLFDPSPGRTRNYQVTVQVLCGKKPGKLADPHDIKTNVPAGKSVTLVAKCPRRSVLIGGGFQRAAFEFAGGVYPTESHMISKRKWMASGTAFGSIKNDMVAIGYCLASPKQRPLLTEVSASTTIAPAQVGFATTPPCPAGRSMVYNGFDTYPKQSLFFADGMFNADRTFTGSAYNKSAAPAMLTTYGYCLEDGVIGGRLKKFSKKAGRLDTNSKTKQDQSKRI